MFTCKKIYKTGLLLKECAEIIRKYSWGIDYPVDPLEELKKSEYIIGCFDGNNIIGLGAVSYNASPDEIDNGLPWFCCAVVLPEYRKQGIYNTLYEKRLEYIKNKKEKFILTCTDNPLVERFLLKNKWVLYRKTKDESSDICKVFKLNIQ